MIQFLHTADWQLGKPYAWATDPSKRAALQQARFDAARGLSSLVKRTSARFVLVAGDLFDSPTPDRATVSKACESIGSIGVPVYAIPGNHDHAGPGSVWEQPYFRQEQEALAPNLTLLTSPEPVEVSGVIILPCPLQRRQSQDDPTAWLRYLDPQAFPNDMPRIILAHGSVQNFVGEGGDDDHQRSVSPNLLELDRIPTGLADYLALGDWHGQCQVGPASWYAGAIEQDRHARSAEYVAGRVLQVGVSRGMPVRVESIDSGRIGWHTLGQRLDSDDDIDVLVGELDALLGGRVGQDVLRLRLSGAVGLAGRERLDALFDTYEARLLRLVVEDGVALEPGADEIESLTSRGQDPVIAAVAQRLAAASATEARGAAVASRALRELFLITRREGGH